MKKTARMVVLTLCQNISAPDSHFRWRPRELLASVAHLSTSTGSGYQASEDWEEASQAL